MLTRLYDGTFLVLLPSVTAGLLVDFDCVVVPFMLQGAVPRSLLRWS